MIAPSEINLLCTILVNKKIYFNPFRTINEAHQWEHSVIPTANTGSTLVRNTKNNNNKKHHCR